MRRTVATTTPMEHVQQLTLTWLRRPPVRAVEPPAPPPELPDRERIHRLARLYHRQLRAIKHDSRAYHALLRQQTEALRQFTLELTFEQADAFMNMYTEEHSAVEREWKGQSATWRPQQPISPTLLRAMTYTVTIVAIALAIYYAL
ncbi:MAG TPA: hypothetical protein VFP90_11765 [Gemmatimonadaceae bacterium]|nr:hypothetical protein [Gemmatimonadaceae bacterium]